MSTLKKNGDKNKKKSKAHKSKAEVPETKLAGKKPRNCGVGLVKITTNHNVNQ